MKLELDRYVPGLLLWVSNKVSSGASQLYGSRFGIGVTDWRLLAYLEIYPWSTATQACELMGLDKGGVSRSLAFLQRNEWVKSRPAGSRKVEYHATASGKRLHDKVIALALAREEALLTGFGAADRKMLIDFLHRLLANLDAVNQVGRGDTSAGRAIAPGSRRRQGSTHP
jgi:DNA-binding MarR family transcriptional regulator